jgi:hypothetical protein
MPIKRTGIVSEKIDVRNNPNKHNLFKFKDKTKTGISLDVFSTKKCCECGKLIVLIRGGCWSYRRRDKGFYCSHKCYRKEELNKKTKIAEIIKKELEGRYKI